jgi:hypothetical protein
MRLLLAEIGRAREIPVHVPLPQEEKLGALCRSFMMAPSIRSRPGVGGATAYERAQLQSPFPGADGDGLPAVALAGPASSMRSRGWRWGIR